MINANLTVNDFQGIVENRVTLDHPRNEDSLPGRQDLSQRTSLLIFMGLLIIATARIAATWTVFNDTVDEPAQIACGMQWLDQKVYRYEPQHPPLARVMVALGPYLAGVRATGAQYPWAEGRSILNAGNHYDRNLTLARLGTLPFFWLASAVVYIWTRRSFGNLAACFAGLCFTTLPAALAHAGLATTDMAATGTIAAAFLALLLWAGQASSWRTVLLGAAVAAAVTSKFSSLVFLPSAALMVLACYFFLERPCREELLQWIRSHAWPLVAVLALASFLVWAVYRFSLSGVPAPELWEGISDLRDRNQFGHPGYLLGQYRETGWWYYYPVALAVKTPIALLALIMVGGVLCWKRRRAASGTYWMPLAFVSGILAFAMAFSHINLGIRHVLPAFAGFAVIAGVGAQHLWAAGPAKRALLAGLLLWMVASSGFSHPDYLAYFNAFAGRQPEKVLVDSDLDWGQDTKRLAQRLKELGAKDVAFDPFNQGYVKDLEARREFPPVKPLSPLGLQPGWNAASITMLKVWRLGQGHVGGELWTDRIPPTERVGKGILLWYAPETR